MASASYHGEDEWINHDPSAEIQTLAQARQAREALQLRIGGASYVEIAEHLNTTARDAQRVVEREIKDQVPVELRDQVRSLTLARLDVLIKRNMIRLASPACSSEEQERAEDRLLKIVDRVVDITGARAPVQVDVTNRDALDEEIALLVHDLTKPVPIRPDVAPRARNADDRIDPDRSRHSGRWQARMHRTDTGHDRGYPDHGYDDPSVP